MLRSAFNLSVLHVIAHTHTVHTLGASSLSHRRILLSLLQFSLCAFAREQNSFDIFGNMYCLQRSAKQTAFN